MIILFIEVKKSRRGCKAILEVLELQQTTVTQRKHRAVVNLPSSGWPTKNTPCMTQWLIIIYNSGNMSSCFTLNIGFKQDISCWKATYKSVLSNFKSTQIFVRENRPKILCKILCFCSVKKKASAKTPKNFWRFS